VPQLTSQWSELAEAPIDHVVLHYLDRKVDVELHLNARPGTDAGALHRAIEQLRELYVEDSRIGRINAVVSIP